MSQAVPFEAPEPEALAPYFPSYHIDSLIACGGMGAVYHGWQVALEREVAIKILPQEFSADEEFRTAFALEAKAMAKLNHPNLIGVYDFGEIEGMLFIIMEFVPGSSLHHATQGMPIEINEVKELMRQICIGVGHAHENGILHRDIKPSNILLDAQNHPKIGDFGLARPIGHSAGEDETIYGTPQYTAPEVVNEPENVDARADVFSLGVLLHELLTGKLPNEDPRPPSAISGCPLGFDAIVKRATNPVPPFRYPDVATLAAEIAKVSNAAVSNVPRRPPTAKPIPQPTASRKKSSSSSGSLWFALLLLGGFGFYYYKYQYKPSLLNNSDIDAIQSAPDPAHLTPDAVDILKTLPEKSSTPPPAVENPPPAVENTLSTEENTSPTEENPTSTAENSPASDPPASDTPENPPATGEAEPSAENAIVPSQSPNSASAFNIEDFLARARNVIKERAKPLKDKQERALLTNLVQFQAQISRRLRDIPNATLRASTQSNFDEEIETLKKDGGRLSSFFNLKISTVPGAEADYEIFKKNEEKIDADFDASLTSLSTIYVRGLELQISRLDPTIDAAPIESLKKIATTAKEEPERIKELME